MSPLDHLPTGELYEFLAEFFTKRNAGCNTCRCGERAIYGTRRCQRCANVERLARDRRRVAAHA